MPGKNYKKKVTPLRSLKADNIGSLINVRAMVTRVSEVKPLISVACYLCEVCGYELYQTVSQRTYTPLIDCISPQCKINNNKGKIVPNFAVSKFTPSQEIKVQETSDQTPVGSIPRSFSVHSKGPMVRKCSPGDIIHLTGVFVPLIADGGRRFKDQLVHVFFVY